MASPAALSARSETGAGRPAALPLYRLLRGPARVALTTLFDLNVEGLEHLPGHGPVIVAANHHHYLDGVVLGVAIPRAISFLVMPRVWRAPPRQPHVRRHIGSTPRDVGRSDVGALRRALATLERGGVVGIFPEGPFSVHGRLEAGLPGVALLALRSGAPVVPAAISGTYEALVGRRLYIPRRRPLRIRFGVPRRFNPDGEASRREMRLWVTERIMADIGALLP